jgi:hypothetical protein
MATIEQWICALGNADCFDTSDPGRARRGDGRAIGKGEHGGRGTWAGDNVSVTQVKKWVIRNYTGCGKSCLRDHLQTP